MPTALWTGVALGLSVAVPLGPVSLLCVQNTLAGGYRQGVITGLAAASAHGLFATAAVLGTGIIAVVLTPWASTIRCVSGAVLLVLGIRILLQQRAARVRSQTINGRASYACTLMLALSNPMTILPYVAVATANVADASLSTWSIPGVILAALSWYAVLSGITSVMRRGISKSVASSLSIVAGGVMIALGLMIATGPFHM